MIVIAHGLVVMAAVRLREAIFIVCCDDNRWLWVELILKCGRMYILSIQTSEHAELTWDRCLFICSFPSFYFVFIPFFLCSSL